jgi:hypothetical protein
LVAREIKRLELCQPANLWDSPIDVIVLQ